MSKHNLGLSCLPLSAGTWMHLVELFGANGACGGCWCMTSRLSGAQYQQHKGEGNKQLLKKLVDAKEPLGVIGFINEKPVAWCSVSPKEKLLQMRNSRLMKYTPSDGTWCIVCLFIKKDFRRKGLSAQMIAGACKYAQVNGAGIVEAYPVVSRSQNMPDVFAWNGLWPAYKKAGFSLIKEVSDSRIIAQYRSTII
jgi:GNAT superfamily N-acetyltransferase